VIRGIGINDSPENYVISKCDIYSRWTNMLRRCTYEYQEMKPTYKGVFVCKEWKSFMNFRKWFLKQGDWKGMQLDKDSIIEGNKEYCPEKCAKVPKEVNMFSNTCTENKGEYDVGVSLCLKTSKYRSSCRKSITNFNEEIGKFETEKLAHEAWRNRKHEIALAIIDYFPELDVRVVKSLKTRYL